MDITDLQHGALLRGNTVDTTANREQRRQRRLLRLLVFVGIPVAWFWYRELIGDPVRPGLPALIRNSPELAFLVILLVLMGMLALLPYLGAGRSPHTLLRPSDSS